MSVVRIGYTCHDAFPSTGTNTQQIFWTLTEVARLGAEVDLYVPALRGTGEVRERLARHYATPDTVVPGGLRVSALGTRPPGTDLARAIFDLRAPRRFSVSTHDAAWTRDLLACAAALRRGLPTFFETYRPDIASRAAFAPWRRFCLGHPSFAGLIVHSHLAARAFLAAGVPSAQVLVAHNGFAPVLMQPVLSREEARAVLGLPSGSPMLVYTGHVGPQKGTPALVRLAAALPEARLVLVGCEGDDRRRVESLAAAAGARNLVLVPRVDVARVAAYLYAADVLVVPPTDEPLARYHRTVLPMKLFPYLAAGRPIVAPRLPDMEEVLRDDHSAVLVPPDREDAAARAVRALLGDAARMERLGQEAARTAAAYTWEARARRIVAFMRTRLGAD